MTILETAAELQTSGGGGSINPPTTTLVGTGGEEDPLSNRGIATAFEAMRQTRPGANPDHLHHELANQLGVPVDRVRDALIAQERAAVWPLKSREK